MMDEQTVARTVARNIETLVNSLNGELKMAQEIGLSVSVSTDHLRVKGTPERISVRVWRETTLAQVPAFAPVIRL